ncbi:MAG TPA: ABC transporter ATP-binding protein [Bryobacteraceae bacterium]|jgi:ATP-binding cassette subfamily B protein|nr:ABC transporter ATP-binding protein [Bryobacteraceae bacterium]
MWSLFRAVAPHLLRYRRGLALGMGSLVLKDIVSASLPLVIRAGVDSLTSGFRIQIVFQFAAILVGLSILKGIFQYWMRVILIGISRDVEYDLRNQLFSHLVTLSSDFYARYRTGDIMARSTNDLNAVRMMLGPGIMYWTETMLTAVLSIAVMLSVDWRLTLICLVPAPLVSIAVMFFGKRIHDRFEVIQKMFSDISSRVQENLSGVRVIRAYAQEKSELHKFELLNQDYVAQNIRLAKLSGLFMPLLQALISLSFLMVLLAGGYQLLEHRISLGSFVMFNTYMGMLVWPMIAIGWVVNLMQRGKASWERIMELMREKPAIFSGEIGESKELQGAVRFEGVEVKYPAGLALKKVDLEITAGETVAIVGHTGSGKSTLVSLIPRLIDPTRGRVLLDGVDLRELDPEWVRGQIGFVPQETFLFSATLAENIAWGVDGATQADIRSAADLAGLAPDIAGFPAGFETVIGERGLTLSGGQKQRVAIARAILRDPRILILDDALSSVDTLTEESILTGLAGVMRGRTTILISHRVSTVQNAHRIFVIEHGEVAEQGTHDQLIASGGYYADLYQKQLLEEELEAI